MKDKNRTLSKKVFYIEIIAIDFSENLQPSFAIFFRSIHIVHTSKNNIE